MADVILRAGALLNAVSQAHLAAIAVAAGYTRDVHHHGVFCYSFAARQRTYSEWLDYEELNPHRDPRASPLLDELERLVDELGVRAALAITNHVDPAHREELLSFVCNPRMLPTRYARAKSRLGAMRVLESHPCRGARAAYEQLVRDDREGHLRTAARVVEGLRLSVRAAPLDHERRAHILSDVQCFERRLATWIADQRTRFSRVATGQELEALGLEAEVLGAAPGFRSLRGFLERPTA